MTTVLDLIKEEGIQEGIQKGIQKGIQEGIQMGRDEDITRLLRYSSLSPQEIASILEVDLSRVLSLAGTLESSPLPRCPDPGKNSHT